MDFIDELLQSDTDEDRENTEEQQSDTEENRENNISVETIEKMPEDKIVVTKKKETSEKKKKSLAKARRTKKAKAEARKLMEQQQAENRNNYMKTGISLAVALIALGGVYYITQQDLFSMKSPRILKSQSATKKTIEKPKTSPPVTVKKQVEEIEKKIIKEEPYIPFG